MTIIARIDSASAGRGLAIGRHDPDRAEEQPGQDADDQEPERRDEDEGGVVALGQGDRRDDDRRGDEAVDQARLEGDQAGHDHRQDRHEDRRPIELDRCVGVVAAECQAGRGTLGEEGQEAEPDDERQEQDRALAD